MTTYRITETYSMVQDVPERIDFHIQSGDYLPYVATLLGFVEEALSKCGSCDITDLEKKLARELRQDLRHVHANYKVVPRSSDDIRDLRPGGNLLPE